MNHTDVDNTENCPLGEKCAQCGSTEKLAVATFGGDMGVGVFCSTVCRSCANSVVDWRNLPVLAAFRAVAEHCGHLGIDLDEMADALKAS